MSTRPGTRTVQIPETLFKALDQLAQHPDVDLPTAYLIANWLYDRLELENHIPGSPAEGIHAPDPRRFRRMYPRRTP